MDKDIKSTKPEKKVDIIDKRETEIIEDRDKVEGEELGTEGTPTDSSTEETSEKVEEKVDELAELKTALDKTKGESEHVRNAMQKRIDQLTYELKSLKERSESNKERTWDDLSSKELTEYIAKYSEEGNGTMIAFLTDKITDKKIEERFKKTDTLARATQIAQQSWQEVTKEFPELEDQESELYKRTSQLVFGENADPRFNDRENFPEGHAVAARMAASQILKARLYELEGQNKKVSKKAKNEAIKNSLDSSSGAIASPDSKTELSRIMGEASDSRDPFNPKWRNALKQINSKK